MDRIQLKTVGLTLAIIAAPFLALLYGLNAGLAVMAIALSFTTYLTLFIARTAGPALRGRLRLAAALNAALAMACLALLIARLIWVA